MAKPMLPLFALVHADGSVQQTTTTREKARDVAFDLKMNQGMTLRVVELDELAEPKFFACATTEEGFSHVITREAAMVAVRRARRVGHTATLYGVVPTKEGV